MALSVAGWVGIALLVFALALAAAYFLKYYYRRHQNNQKINASNQHAGDWDTELNEEESQPYAVLGGEVNR